MSRTYKDKPSKLRFDLYMKDWILVEHDGFHKYRPGKTTKTKKRKEVDTEDHYLSGNPSWWDNLFHTRPIRRKFKNYCTSLIGCTDLSILEPLDSNKPHKYYY